MKLLKRALLLAALTAPGIVNAAMLRFDVSATTSFLTTEIGLLSGSYFVVDTSVTNSSTDPVGSLFANSIVSGHVETMDPINGLVSADITDANSGSISATNDGVNTTWLIPVAGESTSQSADMTINYGGLDLYANLLDDSAIYNNNFLDGTVTANGVTIPFNEFSVSDVSPVPLPPTIFLMATSLVMLLWRSHLSISNIKGLLTTS
jgi:hypothetical protein